MAGLYDILFFCYMSQYLWIVLVIQIHIWARSRSRITNQKALSETWAQTASDTHIFVDINEIRSLTFLTWPWPEFYYKLLKNASHDAMDTLIKFRGQS